MRRGWGSHSADQSSARAVPHVESPKKIGHTMLEHGKHIDDITFDIAKYFGSDGTAILGMVSDMIKAYADLHSLIIRLMSGLYSMVRSNQTTIDHVCIALRANVIHRYREAEFNEVAFKLEHLINEHCRTFIDAGTFENKLYHIMMTISELSEKSMFFQVDSSHVDKYNNAELFGSEVNLIFSGAAQDIKEAGNCYALRQPTACVLHLMRAIELALKTLAHVIPGVTLGTKDTMGMVLAKLQKLASNMPSGTADEAELKRQTHKAALHFHDIIEAIRNEAMHTGAFYSMEEANAAIESTKLFMKDVAKIIMLYEENSLPATAQVTG